VSDHNPIVIVGGGLAGAKAAETLRAEGYGGRLALVGAEADLPYERPPLSKSYLAGETKLAEAQVHDRSFYDEHDIELITGHAATSLDPAARSVELDDGSTLRYARLLIATGAVPRRPPIEGVDREGVHVLRTAADADVLRQVIERGGRLAIIGAGWIGSEVAATARSRGAEVALIEHAQTPLEHVLGRQIGEFFAGLHRRHGVELTTGARVERIEEGPKVVLADRVVVEADAVVLGVGVAPATALAEDGALRIDNGILVDEQLRTSASGVFAAGDVASMFHPRYGRHVRVEHWANAADQGAAAGRSMLDRGEAFTKVPFFFSDQYDLGMEYFGLHGPADRLVIRGHTDDGCFQAFWIGTDGGVTAAMHANDWDASDAIRQIVETGAPLEAVESTVPQTA
jgi:3-phenylpropionate/trans-cinnamate dioxygenase ferredoxin reductase component